jgi:hypothetical protein
VKIDEVKTAKKVGNFRLKEGRDSNKITIDYSTGELTEEELKDDSPRVYLIVSNREIKKIGGSTSKGGIKATISFYINAMQGSPGPSRYIIHRLIERELRGGKEVELYIINSSEKATVKIPGLFGEEETEISSFKEMENRCKEDYFQREGEYPPWNFKENNESYPPDIYQEFLEYHTKRLKKPRN